MDDVQAVGKVGLVDPMLLEAFSKTRWWTMLKSCFGSYVLGRRIGEDTMVWKANKSGIF